MGCKLLLGALFAITHPPKLFLVCCEIVWGDCRDEKVDLTLDDGEIASLSFLGLARLSFLLLTSLVQKSRKAPSLISRSRRCVRRRRLVGGAGKEEDAYMRDDEGDDEGEAKEKLDECEEEEKKGRRV
ncbi:hypothetical protein BDZ90DRAFT_159623 [Jaminaea rosea]|uniref:Uncharacterized protein n=1 Tax=Jaminaea rosea TaxID=1569628 RepID=A0A316UVQ6_9BASI|nr:hypothetical protein BDZ90DRAFT_159623 [Jaminaea rosea]PWN28003.1 hypothetical protein BDZ90DRAFT_159623 [Jaminaea rosea]